MARECIRCLRRLHRTEKKFRYVLEYRYIRSRGELMVDLKKLIDVSANAVIAHHHCEHPEVEGFEQRMRKALNIPDNADHPLLGY